MIRFFQKIKNIITPNCGDSLETLGYPTNEELATIGMTGHDFMQRYIHTAKPRSWESVQQFANRVLNRFYADYPQLEKRLRR